MGPHLGQIGIGSCWFCGGRKSGEPNENPRSKVLGKNQQQTQPTFSTGSELSKNHTGLR